MNTYAGFDAKYYPGIQTMDWLYAKTNLAWCGYYLAPAPDRSDPSWMGQRSALQTAGWGIAPIFVGRQPGNYGTGTAPEQYGQADGKSAATLLV